LTFNPGWDSNANRLTTFTDVRELQRRLKAQGVVFASEADENTTGPAHKKTPPLSFVGQRHGAGTVRL
jgi:hypothetical protein